MELGEENEALAVGEHFLGEGGSTDQELSSGRRPVWSMSHASAGESTNTSLASYKLGAGRCASWFKRALGRANRSCSRPSISGASSISSPARPLHQQACEMLPQKRLLLRLVFLGSP